MKRYRIYLLFLIITATIMWDLLKPGYIFSLDLVFPPYMDLYNTIYGIEQFRPAFITTQLPLYILIGALSKLVPMWLIEKIILFLIIFLSGVSAYRLLPLKSDIARFYAGLTYMINPYVYLRFLAGHWKILLAYALMPLALKYFISFMEKPNKKLLIYVVFLMSLVSMANIHNFILFIIILFLILAFKFVTTDHRIELLKYLIFLVISWFFLNI